MAVSSYPSVLLLDDLNNPITPLVDIDSIYIDAGTKKSESVVCKLDESKINDENKIKCNETDGTITVEDTNFPSSGIVSIITDIRIGDSVVEGNTEYPSHTLKFQKVDLNKLMTIWYEQEYMRNQMGHEIWYGTSLFEPIRFEPMDTSDLGKVTFNNGSYVLLSSLKHLIDGHEIPNHMWRINDYNSTNFLSTDDGTYPRRGKIYPSAEYIWFLIKPSQSDQRGVDSSTLHLYGASGEDSPQEIEFTKRGDSGYYLYCSESKFGIDANLNEGGVGNDGFEYNIYVKYKFIKN